MLQGNTMWVGGRARNGCTSAELLADVFSKDMEIEWLSFHQPGTLGPNGTMLLEPTSKVRWGGRQDFSKSACASHGLLSPIGQRALERVRSVSSGLT